jgi:hypothetical protein|tara:strand:- start:2117 stop:2677 length:561 start_codon:yes stop_codon:yes gene_type:complete
MSDIEREVVSRLVDAGDLEVHIKGWGVVHQPRVIIGDLRIGIHFRMDFDKPEAPVPVHYFDMELKTGSGLKLFGERQSILYNNRPVQIAAGLFFDMVWEIAVNAMDPKIVKMIKPGARGLTSSNFDKDTGNLTMFGNRTGLNSEDKKQLHKVRAYEAWNRGDTKEQAEKATALAEEAVKQGKIKKT